MHVKAEVRKIAHTAIIRNRDVAEGKAYSMDGTIAAFEAACEDRKAIAGQFLSALDQAAAPKRPFPHWLLMEALPPRLVAYLAHLPIAPPLEEAFGEAFVGTREANNSARVFFNPDFAARDRRVAGLVAAFQSEVVRDELARRTGAYLDDALLRVEYCQDRSGFWLEPHRDIAAKRFTLLIYLSDDPALGDAGTDIYREDGNGTPVWAGRTPYGPGEGLIFVPGAHSWHGFEPRPIHGLRKTLIVNYVTPDWRSRHELA